VNLYARYTISCIVQFRYHGEQKYTPLILNRETSNLIGSLELFQRRVGNCLGTE